MSSWEALTLSFKLSNILNRPDKVMHKRKDKQKNGIGLIFIILVFLDIAESWYLEVLQVQMLIRTISTGAGLWGGPIVAPESSKTGMAGVHSLKKVGVTIIAIVILDQHHHTFLPPCFWILVWSLFIKPSCCMMSSWSWPGLWQHHHPLPEAEPRQGKDEGGGEGGEGGELSPAGLPSLTASPQDEVRGHQVRKIERTIEIWTPWCTRSLLKLCAHFRKF